MTKQQFESTEVDGIRQPVGVDPRREKTKQLRNNIKHNTRKLLSQGFLSQKAADYLLGFVEGTLPRAPRPATYGFLNYRWETQDYQARAAQAPRAIRYEDEAPTKRVRVVRLRKLPKELIGLEAAAVVADGGDDAAPGPLDVRA